jgi:hypothetical protein
MTARGNPRTVFRRAIERENLARADLNLRMMRHATLVEALELTALVALKNPKRRSRYAARWLSRWLVETPAATLEDAAIVTAHVGALGGARHGQAVAFLRGIVARGRT